jgi:hypothetical protein
MNKSEKIIVRTVAFLFSALISVSAFALSSSWAWTKLDPAQQETIGAMNTPWIAAQRDQTPVSSGPDTVHDSNTAEGGHVTPTIAHPH